MLKDFRTILSLVSFHRTVVVVVQWGWVRNGRGWLGAFVSGGSLGGISAVGAWVATVAILDDGLGALNNLEGLLGGVSVEQVIEQSLLHVLLVGKILNGSLELVKRVTHVEQIVQVKGEVCFALFAHELRIEFIVYVRVTLFAGLHFFPFYCIWR